MEKPRYTEKQILCGLREFWKYRFRTTTQIDFDTRIDLQMISDNGWDNDELDEVFSELPELFSEVENHFGFECPYEEWEKELGINNSVQCSEEWESEIAPHFTFGALVRFIKKRATAVIFQPVMVIDRECRPAGVFYGFQQIKKDIFEESDCFGPSTKIIDIFCGYKLEYFWSHLNWMTEYRIPRLSSFWSRIDEYGCWLLFFGMMLATVATAVTQNFTYQIVMIMLGYCGMYVTSFYKHRVNPLPPELVTFRDLAVLIAEHECDAVRKGL